MTRLPMALGLAVTLLAAATVQACGEETPMQDSIQQVKQRHEERLMEIPGVVSVGVGRDEAGEDVIVVGLDRERPEAQARLPKRLDGYEIRVEVIGKIRAR